jgi:hypothetical protein
MRQLFFGHNNLSPMILLSRLAVQIFAYKIFNSSLFSGLPHFLLTLPEPHFYHTYITFISLFIYHTHTTFYSTTFYVTLTTFKFTTFYHTLVPPIPYFSLTTSYHKFTAVSPPPPFTTSLINSAFSRN